MVKGKYSDIFQKLIKTQRLKLVWWNNLREKEQTEEIEVPEGIPKEFREQWIEEQRKIRRYIDEYKRDLNEKITELVVRNKELGMFYRGIAIGAAFGILGNFLVSYFIEFVRVFFANQQQWVTFTGILLISSLISVLYFFYDTYKRIKSSISEIEFLKVHKERLKREPRWSLD